MGFHGIRYAVVVSILAFPLHPGLDPGISLAPITGPDVDGRKRGKLEEKGLEDSIATDGD